MQRALWFQSGAPVLLINSLLRSAPRQGLASPSPGPPGWAKGPSHPPKNPMAGLGGRTVPGGSCALSEHPPQGGHHFWVPLAGGFTRRGRVTGCRHASVRAVGWSGPRAHPHLKHPGCRAGSHRAQAGRARVPERGRGSPAARVAACAAASPHAGGAFPVITASATKLQSRAGASLPPSRPPCLSHPHHHRSPNPPGTGPMAAAPALPPAHPRPVGLACALSCPGGCQPPPATSSPRMEAGGGGKGVAPAPSQDKDPAPALPPCPKRGLTQAHPTSPQGLPAPPGPSSEGLGSEKLMPDPAAPGTVGRPLAQGSPQCSHPAWHDSKEISCHAYPGQEVGKPHRGLVPKCPQVGASGLNVPGQRARAARGGQRVGVSYQPHTEPSLPGKGIGDRGEGGPWEVLGATERHWCAPGRHTLLQGLLCVLVGWVEAVVNSSATALQVGPGHCQQSSPPLG